MRVAVLGCGYVGRKLGRQLIADDHEVVGVARGDESLAAIQAAGLDAVRADVTDGASLSAVPDADAVVFAASAGARDATAAREVYVDGLRTVIEHFGDRDAPPARLVYTSSTGVYGDHGGDWVDESTPLDPATERERVLVEAERIAREEAAAVGIDGTVARYAGLYGPERYRLGRYLDGPVTEGYRNLIHREDAAGAVAHLLRDDVARDDVVLVVDDEPVDRWEFADWLAAQCGRDPPPKVTVDERLDGADLPESAQRRIRTDKRCANGYLRSLGYEFRYPTYREGYRAAIAGRPGGSGS